MILSHFPSVILSVILSGLFSILVFPIIYVIMSMAIHSSVRSASIEFKGKIKDYCSTISLIYILNFVVLVLLSIPLFGFLYGILEFERTILIMLLLYSFSTGIVTLYNQEISLNYSYKKYILVALANSLGNLGLSLLLIFTVFRDNRLYLRADDPIAFSERYSFGYFIRAVFHISIPHILVQYTPYFCACFSDIFGKWDLYSPCISLTICSDIWIGSGVVGSVRINFAPG